MSIITSQHITIYNTLPISILSPLVVLDNYIAIMGKKPTF